MNETSIYFLRPGQTFEIVGLEKKYRNLYLVRSSESGSLIRGEININSPIQNPKWSVLSSYTISNGTVVKLIDNNIAHEKYLKELAGHNKEIIKDIIPENHAENSPL